MSSRATILEITPLLPWRPASLSPSEILRFLATNTRTRSLTPGGRSSPSSRLKVLTSMTTPPSPWGHLERGVTHLARLLLEDRADQLLLGGQLGLALRRDLADEQVAGVDLGADAHDAAVVEVAQRLLGAVRDVAGDLLVAELGRAGVDLVLLDVDRGELVVLDEALGEDDGVLEVVALPGHEGDQQVLAEGHLALVGGGAVGEHVALLDLVADVDDRLLVDQRALVGAHELLQLVLLVLALAGVDRRSWSASHVRRPCRPRASRTSPVSSAARRSMPVPTSGASAFSSGTAWRCMFEPISARLASSCSRNGIIAVATDKICCGERPSGRPPWAAPSRTRPPGVRHRIWSSRSLPVLGSNGALAWAIVTAPPLGLGREIGLFFGGVDVDDLVGHLALDHLGTAPG